MSIYRDSDGATSKLGVVDEALWGDLILELPNLIDAMTGVLGPDGRWKHGPATFMIFLEGGKLKFCLSPKFSSSVAFGVVADPDKPFHSIEAELQAGHFEWKTRSRKN